MLKKQEGLNHVGKGTVMSMTLFVIQILFRPKPIVKHLKFKVDLLTVTLRSLKSTIYREAPYIAKAKKKFRARFNNYKSPHRFNRKKPKVSQQRFHEH